MKNSILFLLVFVASFSCYGQTSSNSTPDNILDNFFRIYEKSGLYTSVDTLFSYGDKDVFSALSYIKDTLAGTIKNAGKKYCGSDLIIKKVVSPSYIFYSYLVKYPTHPVRFNFIFYKPETKWIMVDFSFNSNIGSEAESLGALKDIK